ncbi:MAG: diaminopimelate epimerase [Myxococcota bacterium]
MNSVAFGKYHGLGNDFILIRRGDFPDEQRWVEALCDRHHGLGADGVLYFDEREHDGDPAVRMIIHNRDGSRPEMCGNGVRCVALMAVETLGFERDELVVLSDAGPRRCRFGTNEDGEWTVTVDMGDAAQESLPNTITIAARDYELWSVDMGNPHAVTFHDATESDVDAIGATLNDDHPLYAKGVNVEFVDVVSETAIEVTVYERGVGRTMACGTGACAAAVVAIKQGRVRDDHPVKVHLPGGVLEIEVDGDHVWMTGPVEHVCDGEVTDSWMRTRTLVEMDNEQPNPKEGTTSKE